MIRPLCIAALAFVAALASAAPETAPASPEEGFTSLFNGKDLAGWEGNPKLWSVQDGAIVGQTTKENATKGNTFLFWRDGTLKDFELRLDFRLTGGNNSGVQYRSRDVGNFVASGYQCDLNSGPSNMLKLYEERGRGRIAMPGEKVVIDKDGKKNVTGKVADEETLKKLEKKGDWNQVAIIARGNHLQHQLNGTLVMELTDEHEAKRAMEGLLALQIHAGGPMKIEVRNIRMKVLAK